jgi:hypothetical protein
MKLEIFFTMKEKYEIITNHLSEIVSSYDDMINLLNNEDPTDKNAIYELELMMRGKKMYQDKIVQIAVFINLCNKKQQQMLEKRQVSICEHEFITDYIDVDIERCQKITYCSKCNATK